MCRTTIHENQNCDLNGNMLTQLRRNFCHLASLETLQAHLSSNFYASYTSDRAEQVARTAHDCFPRDFT